MAKKIPLSSMTNTKYKRPSYGAAAPVNKKMAAGKTAAISDAPRITKQDKSTLYPTKRSIDKNYGKHNARDGRAMEKLK